MLSPPETPMKATSNVVFVLSTLSAALLLAGAFAGGCAAGDEGGDTSNNTPESCQNGIDDDDDDNIDCADPDCSGYRCAPSIPDGWTDIGYVAVAKYTAESEEPECPPEHPTEKYKAIVDPNVNNQGCTPCTCGDVQGECTLPDLDTAAPGLQGIKISSRPCGDAGLPTVSLVSVPDPWDGACYSANAYLGGQTNCLPSDCNVSVTTGALETTTTCEASGGQPTEVKGAFYVKLCGGSTEAGAGCGGGACLAKPAAAFDAGICVAQHGGTSCPEGFPLATVAYDPAEITPITCTECGCDLPAGAACSGSITLYSDTQGVSCATEVVSFSAGTCIDLVGNPTVAGRVLTLDQKPSGACTPTPGGGVASGVPQVGIPTLICCTE